MKTDVLVGLALLASATLGLFLENLPPFGPLSQDPKAIVWASLLLGSIAFSGLLLVGGHLYRREAGRERPLQVSPNVKARQCSALLAIAGYLLALPIAGFYVAGLAFSFFGARAMGLKRWRDAALFAGVLTFILWVVFGLLLEMPLPKSSLL